MTLDEIDENKLILVIDDDDTITNLIKTILTKEGYTVKSANDGIVGVEMAQNLGPDIILMDITMPGIDGYEATKKIKQDPKTKDIPIIFLTGKSASEDGGKAFAMGGVTFMRKPFQPQQLKDLVRLALESIRVE